MMIKHKTSDLKENILSENYVSSLLLFLFKKDEVHTADLKDISSYYQGIVNKAEILQDLGLIDIKEQSTPYHKKTFKLTKEGKKVAEKLYEAEIILKDILDRNKR